MSKEGPQSLSSEDTHPLPALNTQASQAEIEAHAGVATVKATHQVYGKYSKWFLFLG